MVVTREAEIHANSAYLYHLELLKGHPRYIPSILQIIATGTTQAYDLMGMLASSSREAALCHGYLMSVAWMFTLNAQKHPCT
jgi:hypothetical protein